MTSANEKCRVEMPKELWLGFDDKETLTSLEAPEMELDKYREVHFEYSEDFNNAHKSINIETYLTYGELIELCRELFGGA